MTLIRKIASNTAAVRMSFRHRPMAIPLSVRLVTTHQRQIYRSIHIDENVILMGSPGCGKTTVGAILAAKIGRRSVDIDNDYLESHWGMTVANKLEAVGGDSFVREEGEALQQFTAPPQSVISLTGSNPMHKEGMDHIRKQGTVVFLDVQGSDIVERLERMKVNRIVGQGKHTPMADILRYRQQFYEGNYDVRVLCEANEDPHSIADKVSTSLTQHAKRYVSTRGVTSHADFNDVILEGLAPDGGLYVPGAGIPRLSINQWSRLLPLSYRERALRVLEQWIHPRDLSPAMLCNLIGQAYTVEKFGGSGEVCRVVRLADNQYINELFHGPTASFKDAALQLMPGFFRHAMQQGVQNGTLPSDPKFVILVATSGDTGGAVLYGFKDLARTSGVRVMVLYPERGVSDVQRRQMTSLPGEGLHVVGVKSDFDFCQTAIKQIFNDVPLAEKLRTTTGYQLSAANSINWGRLLPQVVYHVSAYLDLVGQGVVAMGDPVDLCIPTGNFGNILAAYYAKEMGIPYRRLTCASNVNNVLTSFIRTGCYDLTQRKLHVTASPAIDILKSSNLERFLYHVTGNDADFVAHCYADLAKSGRFQIPNKLLSDIQDIVDADWCSEKECFATISNTYKETGYILDPHTAVAKHVTDRRQARDHQSRDTPLLIASTAHYAKFPDHVLDSLRSPRGHEKLNEDQMSSTGLSASELYAEFDLLSSKSDCSRIRPEMHEELRESVKRPVVHRTVLEANVNEIVSELRSFVGASNMKSR